MTSTVLVIDDNDATRALVRAVVERAQMTCVEARFGSEARDVVERASPDLILLDLGLPDASTAELVDELRSRVGSSVPIVALAGIATSDARLALGPFDHVVAKPLDEERVRLTLSACIPEGPTAARSLGLGRRVLLADDDAVQRKMVAFKLGRMGFSVVTATDGAEALLLARRERPDAIVSDVLMPNVDGFELCSRLRAESAFARTPIVLLTNSYVEPADRELAKRVGADAYVIRNPELTDLVDSLQQTLAAGSSHAPTRGAVEREVLRERSERAARQLDRQVAENAVLQQRTAILAAELAIIGGLTSALAENRDVDAAMDAALGSCFDAGDIAWGLLLVADDGAFKHRSLGLAPAESAALGAATDRIVGLLRVSGAARPSGTPSRGGARGPQVVDLGALLEPPELASWGARSTLLVPIVHQDELMGAILLGSRVEFEAERVAFASVVAGQMALVLAVARALQERERASGRERERAEQLAGILDAIGEPILVIDRDCRPLLWNQAAQPFASDVLEPHLAEWPAIHGLYRADQSTLYPWTDLPLVRAARGDAIDGAEVCVRKKGADARWLSITARPVRGGADELRGAVAVIRDVTLDKRSQENQIVADRMASIGVLAAGIAHEINNPMTSVLAELDMAIEDAPQDSDFSERLRAARDAAVRVTTIVRDLKTLSRGGANDEIGLVDLQKVIDAAVRMAAPETRARAAVTVEIDAMPRVLGNEARLVQVVLNLLVNAAQAIGQAATERARRSPPTRPAKQDLIHVRGGTGHDGGALIAVADTGIGVSPEVRARLFTPFFTTKAVGAGSGLGLSISQRIVAGLGGSIECDSTALGTVFRVWIPAAPDGGFSAGTPIDRPRGRLRVLVVDPDPLARQVVARGLRAEHDLLVLDSTDAAAARVTAGERFDLFLWAVSGGAQVTEVVEHVASIGESKVASLTLVVPSRLEAYAARAAEARGCAFLVKPFDAAGVARYTRSRISALGWAGPR